ncbi:MAG: nuclear transport factor 2 family protein [Pseudomonadota bacterium]
MRWSGDIADRLAVRELIEAYGDAVFRRDADAFTATWTEDAVWELMGERREGRDAIRSHWEGLMAGFDFAAMYWTGGGCRIGAAEGDGSWYALEILTAKDGQRMTVSGRYDDRYRKGTDGVWRFAARTYTVLDNRD